MTEIKICGITNRKDARAAVELGARALGFVFAPSPRRVDPGQAREIALSLPPEVLAVGVFVDASQREMAGFTWLSGIQLHGQEPPELLAALPQAWKIKSFRMKTQEDLAQLSLYLESAQAFLLDTRVEGLAGGSGRCFDWNLAVKARELGKPLILAGGLNPANVAEAIARVRPAWVDVSTGVESAPGRKDYRKMKEFIANVRSADSAAG